jgi:ribose-phosphate pyrophosphokinase
MRGLLFALPHHEGLAAAIARETGSERGRMAIGRFANGELRVTIDTPCAGRRCVLLGATAPPDGDLLLTSLVAHTLGKEGAGEIVSVIPYLGYARQDRAEPGQSLGAAWVGRLLAGVGVGAAVSVDVHSALVAPLFAVPLVSLSPAAIFAAALHPLALEDVTVVAPDEGARERAEAVRVAAGIDRPVVAFVKMRAEAGIRHVAMRGQVGRSAIVVDDILDTGGTLVSACERLRDAGTRTIVLAVTHGLFTGKGWERLWDLGVSRIYCTDTTPPARVEDHRVSVLSIAPVLARYLATSALGRAAAVTK